jgi:DNA-binding MarR family transcriptional regulator
MNVSNDPETRLAEGDHELLRLWLRLFTCSTMIERQLGTLLKREFGSTLPRFDLLAQLTREPQGLSMAELSSRLLVTGGNVTWLVTSLARDEFVTRTRSVQDKRSAIVKLTPLGKRNFMRMARAHEQWVTSLLSNVSERERRALYLSLGAIKQHLRTTQEGE